MSDSRHEIGGVDLLPFLAGALVSIAYLLWPDGVLDVPLTSITIGALLRMIAAGYLAFVAILILLNELIDNHRYYEHLRDRRDSY